jgi:hypothetical protein
MWGGNAIEGYLDNERELCAHWKRLHPPAMLIMSDAGSTRLAREVKQDNPEATVIFRPYHPQDHGWHAFKSAEEIWEEHRRYATDGLVVQVWNEPSGYTDVEPLIEKATKVARFAREEGRRVALPHFGVGHPSEHLLAAGALDPLLRELSTDRRAAPNLWATHEYGLDTTRSDPYRVGRVKGVLERARDIGAPIDARRVVITEYGRDKGGHAEGDGWKVYFKGDERAYFNWMLPGVEHYRAAGYLGICLFAYGKTWPSFDVQHARTLWSLMEAWNEEHGMATIPKPTSGGVRARLTRLPGAFVNIRAQPNGADLGDLHAGDAGTLYPDAPSGGWLYFAADKGVEGWVSLQNGAVAFTPVDEGGERGLTPHQYARLKAISTDLAALVEEVRPLDSGGGF